MKKSIKISHLYPKHLSLYGDRGNIMILTRRAEWRGYSVEICHCSIGDNIPEDTDIIFLGGGQDHDQELIVEDILTKRDSIANIIERGGVCLGICGGYQLMGEYYEMGAKRIRGLGLLNYHTQSAQTHDSRIIGNVTAITEKWGEIWGYENHGGRTFLGEGLNPLATITQGGGNNGTDKTEGVYACMGQGLIIGTYFHTFLPKNPIIADYILAHALNVSELSPLSDDIENMNKNIGLKLAY